MAYIGIKPAESFTSFATQTFSTSATSSYTLDHAVTNENELALFINNVRQQPGSGKAYTATGTTLTLSANTASTDTMYAIFLGRALQTVNPASASVGSSQITAEMITGTTALAAEPADTDEFLVSDAGVLKRIDYSLIKGSSTHTLLSTTTVSSATATIDITSNIDSTYKIYMFDVINLNPSADNKVLVMRYKQASAFVSGSVYDYGHHQQDANNSEAYVHGTGDTQINMLTSAGNAADEDINGRLFLFNPSDTTFRTLISWDFTYMQNAGYAANSNGGGGIRNTTATNGVQFLMNSGNIDSAIIKLYGVT